MNNILKNEKYNEDEFCREFYKTPEQIAVVKDEFGVSLEEFFNHYQEVQLKNICELEKELSESFLFPLMGRDYVNSVKARHKDQYHFIDKIVRKANTESRKYKGMNLNNYHLYIDDLLGMRIILLYIDDWYKIHQYIIKNFELDNKNYLCKTYRTNLPLDKSFIIEEPDIKIRNGDLESVFRSHFPLHDFPYKINKNTDYRSIHYTVYYKGYCFELQLRSIFDEAWSEIDHNILYPNLKNKPEYNSYSKFINRLSGLSNEMSSYFKNILIPYMNVPPDVYNPITAAEAINVSDTEFNFNNDSLSNEDLNYDNALNNIIMKR